MSSLLSTAKAYMNFALELRRFLRNPITLDEAKAVIAGQVDNREENFLRTLQASVFDYPQSPYLPLFRAAKLSHADVEGMIGQQGLEGALGELYAAGVYATFEEIKGREPVKRGDLEIPVKAKDFDSPNVKPIAYGSSGGSTGSSTQKKLNLAHIAQQSKRVMMSYAMNDALGAPAGVWRGLFPDTGGVGISLQLAHSGYTMERWFSPVRAFESGLSPFYHALSYLMVVMARLHGLRMPFPQYVPLDDPLPIAKWAAEAVRQKDACLIRTTVSKAVRISWAAQQHGIDLAGTTLYGGGEPPTPGKIAAIEASGAKFVPHYSTSEAGSIGIACGNPATPDDLHLMSNHVALVQHPVTVFDQVIDAFFITTLLPSSPKTLINAQTDDYGIVETRSCGCLLDEAGLGAHLRDVRSYRKLTGEGMTLVGSDMVHIIEEVMPARFGGGPLDYQLVEEEDEQGYTKLVLYVNPSLPLQDEVILADAFLDAMQHSMPSARIAQAEYRHGDVIKVRREKPLVTSRGKQFPIRTLHHREHQ